MIGERSEGIIILLLKLSKGGRKRKEAT